MIIISPARIASLVVMICLADILRCEGKILCEFHIESGIPATFLKPGKRIAGEVTPIRLGCKMDGQRRLRDMIINLGPGTKYGGVGSCSHLPCRHDSLAES